MNAYVIPQWVNDRVMSRRGKLVSHENIDAKRTALIVVDMQNYFVAEGYNSEVPAARGIVKNINFMAKALRSAGGTVVWLQTTATGPSTEANKSRGHTMLPARRQRRLTELAEKHEGFKLFPELQPATSDLRVKKIRLSPFAHGSSDLDERLKKMGIEHLIITGTLTNVCCECSARDAMMLDYGVIMLSDGNAALSEEEHFTTLNNIMIFFGDVMTTQEAIGRLVQ